MSAFLFLRKDLADDTPIDYIIQAPMDTFITERELQDLKRRSEAIYVVKVRKGK